MSSLLTNTSAMTALQTLRGVSANLATTQNRISTGLRVSTASDNAAYWSIATTMRSDNMALSAVQDALGLGAATIDTMYTGLNGTVDVVSQIKAKLVAARTPGVDRGKIQSEITELQKQLKNTADSAVFNGENWISVDSGFRRLQRLEVGRVVVLPRRRRGQHLQHRRQHRFDQAVRQEVRFDPGHQRGDWRQHRHLRGGCAASSPCRSAPAPR